MPTQFPTQLDAFSNPAGTSPQQGSHSTQHANANDAIEALQAKVGIDGSTNPDSLDYKVARKIGASDIGQSIAPLVDGVVPSTYLPGYVDDVLEFSAVAEFPGTGESGKIYVALDSNRTYRWSGSAYVGFDAAPGSTDAVAEGASNLYFTYQRVRDTVLTALSTATSTVISAADTVLEAFGKLQAQVTNKVDKVTGKGLSANDYTDTEKTKLAGVADGANAYTHPANHAPSIITQDASNRFVSDTEKSEWSGKQPAGTYASGTGSAAGTNTGDETATTIKSKLGISTLSGSNTGDQTLESLGAQAALGFTPYDATNPSGFQTSAQVASAVSGKESAITDGATSQFWRGDKVWTDFATTVRATVLTGINFISGVDVTAADTVLQALGKLQAKFTALVSSAGSSFVGFIQAGVGAIVRAIQEKLRESVSVADFGAIGNGIANDSAAVLAAAVSLGVAGGRVLIPNGMKCLIDTSITIPHSVSIVGPHNFVGTPGDNYGAPYDTMGGSLIINSAASITVSSGASLNGLLIYRKGMTFPAADASGFAGTAVIFSGDDCAVGSCMILGFNQAIIGTMSARPRIDNLLFDCNNGIDLSTCYDVAKITNCQGWPFATVVTATPLSVLHRSGTAYYLHDAVDVPFLSNCFAYGYLNGFHFKNVSTVSATNCSSDNTGVYAGSVGWRFEGAINGFQSAACSAWSCNVGVYAAHTNGQFLPIIGFGIRANTSAGIAHYSGNLDVFHNYCTGSPALYSSGHADVASQVVKIDYNTTDVLGTALAVSGYASTTLFVGTHNTTLGTPTNALISGTVPTCPTLASASPLIPYNYADTQIVTGTTNFGALGGGWAGRELTLVFRGILTVFHSTNAMLGMRLNGSANFVSAVGSTLTLKHDGTQWFEVGRSA